MERIIGCGNCRKLMLWSILEISVWSEKSGKHWISLIGSAICHIVTRYSFVATMMSVCMEPTSMDFPTMYIISTIQKLRLMALSFMACRFHRLMSAQCVWRETMPQYQKI